MEAMKMKKKLEEKTGRFVVSETGGGGGGKHSRRRSFGRPSWLLFTIAGMI